MDNREKNTFSIAVEFWHILQVSDSFIYNKSGHYVWNCLYLSLNPPKYVLINDTTHLKFVRGHTTVMPIQACLMFFLLSLFRFISGFNSTS